MRATIGFGLAAALALTTAPTRAQDVTGQAKAFVGTYRIISGKSGDKEVPKERLHDKVVVTKDTMTTFDKENSEVYVISYALEGKSDLPQTISMTVTRSSRKEAEGKKAWGLIKADGDKLMLIYDFKGKSYPTDFTPRNDGQNMFVLERQSGK